MALQANKFSVPHYTASSANLIMPGQRVDFVGTDGLHLAADVWGDCRNPPIVFFPGAGQTRHAWRRAAKMFAAQTHYVISLDLRGHGESDWASDGNYSIDAFVGDVRAVMNALASPPILVGASIGGIAALIALAEHPELSARGLILVDVVPSMPGEGLDRIRAFMSAGANGFANIEAASSAIASYLPHRRAKSSAGLKKNLRRGTDGRLYWHWDPAFHAGSKQRADQGMFARMATAASAIRIPTLLVSGAQSEVVNREGVAQLMRLIPHAEWFQVQDAAHMVAGDKNDAFNAAVSDFVAHLPAGSEARTS